MIRNINYRGTLSSKDLAKISFPWTSPPHQRIFNVFDGSVKLIVFRSGKCRLMGLKEPLQSTHELPYVVHNLEIQSATVVMNFRSEINILRLSHALPLCERIYEPELFPALRLTKYRPMCVNVFASGKIVILGLKDLSNQERLKEDICNYIRRYL